MVVVHRLDDNHGQRGGQDITHGHLKSHLIGIGRDQHNPVHVGRELGREDPGLAGLREPLDPWPTGSPSPRAVLLKGGISYTSSNIYP